MKLDSNTSIAFLLSALIRTFYFYFIIQFNTINASNLKKAKVNAKSRNLQTLIAKVTKQYHILKKALKLTL